MVGIYLLTLAVLLPVGGRLREARGRRGPWRSGWSRSPPLRWVFGWRTGRPEIVVCRGSAGCAAALLVPVALALIYASACRP
ncbi:hypothetical protein Acsp06_50510 [Actinomycetospora sp. NBRC 106375]|nr:hypothetical protein Acsp06_50510 [Actinomycetospora sp. NBRC 106375]